MGTAAGGALAPAKANEFEQAIQGLRGVRSAKVEVGIWGEVSVRVVVDHDRTPQGTVEDVRSIAFQKLGFDINAAKIRVLRAGNGHVAKPLARAKLASLGTQRLDGKFRSRLALRFDGKIFIGETEVAEGEQFENRSVARATLKAIQKFSRFPAELEAVEILKVGASPLAVVTLTLQSETLVGSARVKRDEPQAIARAVLDALNRPISLSR